MFRTFLAAAACVAMLAAADSAVAENLLSAADSGYDNFSSAAGYLYSVRVPNGGSYAGISTTVGSNLGSTATIEEGENDSGAEATVSMQWRTRTYAEVSEQHPPLPLGEPHLVSDVLNLQGVQGAFALQISYSPLVEPEAMAQSDAAGGSLFLCLLSSSPTDPLTPEWVNAATGSPTIGTSPIIGSDDGTSDDGNCPFLESFADFRSSHTGDLSQYVGDWGVNTNDSGDDADTVWAILDGLNGEFAVVPEPGTLVLAAVGGIGLLPLLRRKRAAILRGLNRLVRVGSRQSPPTRLVGEN